MSHDLWFDNYCVIILKFTDPCLKLSDAIVDNIKMREFWRRWNISNRRDIIITNIKLDQVTQLRQIADFIELKLRENGNKLLLTYIRTIATNG